MSALPPERRRALLLEELKILDQNRKHLLDKLAVLDTRILRLQHEEGALDGTKYEKP